MQIDYIYIDEKGRTITRLKPQKPVEQYRAHSGGLWGNDTITEITGTMEDSNNESKI
tara:strand:+ start:401 stop:571 length:171 start_codon:yes stop_codon:yes gene_type:complete